MTKETRGLASAREWPNNLCRLFAISGPQSDVDNPTKMKIMRTAAQTGV
ncbi:hypothetical protein [Bradyrhizobium sp. S3.2.12]